MESYVVLVLFILAILTFLGLLWSFYHTFLSPFIEDIKEAIPLTLKKHLRAKEEEVWALEGQIRDMTENLHNATWINERLCAVMVCEPSCARDEHPVRWIYKRFEGDLYYNWDSNYVNYTKRKCKPKEAILNILLDYFYYKNPEMPRITECRPCHPSRGMPWLAKVIKEGVVDEETAMKLLYQRWVEGYFPFDEMASIKKQLYPEFGPIVYRHYYYLYDPDVYYYEYYYNYSDEYIRDKYCGSHSFYMNDETEEIDWEYEDIEKTTAEFLERLGQEQYAVLVDWLLGKLQPAE
ncbi:hypothetical protein SAMN02745221_01998 [Thermosyntropha lipolytica DSM 11003]|uniref:Uncharacterized protein n=1 Tax=Thermosyntropha lipolytica DSM 11003 TaxID=1123382 RepID=A0A1M5RC14_9FIRM|nr:hypothetical protein [Thermosyntropha lipolytica]SHH23855.1 hypothetical protein SAMN02745221_01998 [Thermosyntropha lipolytica DSM 11003]